MELETLQPEPTRYQCRHIFTAGRRCAGPALKNEQLCYHHHTIRLPIDPIALRTRRARTVVFELPPPEDPTSIQHSLGEILSRLASHDLDHRRAGVMLYCLHIATRNLKDNQPKPSKHAPEEESEIVEEIVHDPVLGPLAPVAELTRPKSFVANLLENFKLQVQLSDTQIALATTQQELEALRAETLTQPNTPQPTTLPTVQAVARDHSTEPLQDLPASADKVIDRFSHGGKVRALIVDDSIVMRRVLERMLREAGLNLTELLQASNGEQALEVLREDAARRLDIILCDINMPVMDGVRFLECRHTENLAAGVPVLVIATDACRPQVLDALAAGARGYIAKPFTVEQVKAQLTQLLHAA